MGSQLQAVTFEAEDATRATEFWAALLGGRHQPGQVGLRFVPGRGGEPGANPMHPHLTSTDLDDQQRTVETARKLGARHLDVGQRPEEGHIVLADPAGYEFCVIEPSNAYLAGCGFLAELTCDGSRAGGVFWSEALGWPLVWDRDGETAIQSPAGGTKIAWGGGPPTRAERPHRQRFHLIPAPGDHRSEADRLIALGARPLGSAGPGTALLADPDGHEFTLSLQPAASVSGEALSER